MLMEHVNAYGGCLDLWRMLMLMKDINVYEWRMSMYMNRGASNLGRGKFSFVPNCPYVLPYRPNFLGLVAGGLNHKR